jgi:hypothetical protein
MALEQLVFFESLCFVLAAWFFSSNSIVHGFDEFDGRAELRPPVLILTFQPLAVKTVYVFDGGQQTWRIGLRTKDFHHFVPGTFETFLP